jgi:signal transduction histidine kinase
MSLKIFLKALPPPVYPGEILQVISNMIANSLDALSDEGTLRLRLRKRGSDVYFVIADSGHGIAEEHTHKIFQPFFTTKGERGTGLGLSLSRKIIERHRGKISMRSSVRQGKTGTTFRVRLPEIMAVAPKYSVSRSRD